MEKIFYNSSLPRSGSSLIQNLLAQNPDFYVTPTSGVLELVFGARMNYTNSPEFKAQDSQLMKIAFLNFCKEGMTGFFEGITDKKYVVDKSRGWSIHYNLLNEIFPDPKIIVMVRDLREIITSMEKKYRKNQHLHDDITNHAKMQGTSTLKRTIDWMNTQPVGLAVERLMEIINQGIYNKVHFIKYEDLLIRPDVEMRKIYEYFGVENYKHDFKNIEQITQEDDSVYGIYGDHVIKKELSTLSFDYPVILPENVQNWLLNNFRWYFEFFKYHQF